MSGSAKFGIAVWLAALGWSIIILRSHGVPILFDMEIGEDPPFLLVISKGLVLYSSAIIFVMLLVTIIFSPFVRKIIKLLNKKL